MNNNVNSIILFLCGGSMLMVGLFVLNPNAFINLIHITHDNIGLLIRLAFGIGLIISGFGLLIISLVYENRGR